MKNLLLILTILLLCSCWQSKVSEKQVNYTHNKTIVVSDSLYKIISEEEHVDPRFGFNKCNLLIELNAKISKDELTVIAKKLRKTRSTYDKLWIGYYLKSMKDRSITWATTNFTPNLEVDIFGSSDIEDVKMNTVAVDGIILGKWQDVRPGVECGIIIYSKNKKLFMKRTFSDASSGENEFTTKKKMDRICYEPKHNTENIYYLVEENGNLGMYGNDGKFGEAMKKN